MNQLKDIATKSPKDVDKKTTKDETLALLEELNQLQNVL